MPLVIAALIRSAIQMAVTLGLIEAGSWLIDQAVQLVAKMSGATEEQAKDITANAWIQGMEAIGVGVLTLQSKTPTKIAEKLGFTSKGFKPRPSLLGEKPIVRGVTAGATISAAEKTAAITKAAETIAVKKRTTFDTVVGAAQILIAALGLPIGFGIVITNSIDFGAWSSSAYQDTFQKILAIFGLEPDRDYVKAQVLSEDMSQKILAVYTAKGASSIKDPRTDVAVPFNRDNFISIADFVAAQIIYEQGSVTTKQMLVAMTALVTLGNKPAVSVVGAATTTPVAQGGISGTKVFTGIVSQGTLGTTLSFIPRPDDIIESIYELQDAAQNNLASYLVTLPGRVIYELKIVSSVTTQDGFRQVGAAQRIISGYTAVGAPRYKTVINKFAVMNLYIMTDKNRKSKIASIILGPTDAIKFQPTTQTLAALEQSIKENVITSDLNDIQLPASPVAPIPTLPDLTRQDHLPIISGPVAAGAAAAPPVVYTSQPAQLPPTPIIQPAPAAPVAPMIPRGGNTYFIYKDNIYVDSQMVGPYSPELAGQVWQKLPNLSSLGRLTGSDNEIKTMLAARGINIGIGQITSVPAAPVAKPGADAQTLYDWYTANGRALPSVAERSQIYQQAGLGLATLYTGTAEQNTKLLNALKSGVV